MEVGVDITRPGSRENSFSAENGGTSVFLPEDPISTGIVATVLSNNKQNKTKKPKPHLLSEFSSGLGNQMSISQNKVTPSWQLAYTAAMCYIKAAHYSSLFVA